VHVLVCETVQPRILWGATSQEGQKATIQPTTLELSVDGEMNDEFLDAETRRSQGLRRVGIRHSDTPALAGD